ncbi:hypothetical protein PMZ80_005840 [Knufia obscura]|uniref:Phosphoglycerate mutase-like protein n=2 Tax=Knufia TaxID=430999 RepID=A0AAN8EMT2_9EURO|nr:hypothetical protein PMZ80_005840 [Knufia obscura]KAK5954507.1 hypothetical protein OHC33_004229 [Knufia fluminis]
MVSRAAVLGTFVTLLFLYYNTPWVQQALCPSDSPGYLTYICPDALEQTWNLFYHLGGNGPWIPRRPESGSEQLPLSCEIDQVHMMSRHAERYPTLNAGTRHIALLARLQAPGVQLSESLEFLKEWTYFTNISDPSFDDLTDAGPYAGTLQSFNTGKKLRERYDHLVKADQTANFWTCSAARDIETAKHFGNGFFGATWEGDASAKLQIIPETADRGGDTLTPGDTCLKYVEDEVNGHDRGYAELVAWQEVFTKPISERLKAHSGGLDLSPLEIYGMMELCGFEILARGSSPWCNVFSHEEWLDFEYGRDLLHFYRAGPGNDFAGAMGWLWLNATTTLLADSKARGVYFSFVHDGDIVPLLATLGILDEAKGAGFLPNKMRKSGRKWKTSDVTPMGGRVIFEKVTCNNTGLGQNLRRSYVRLFINDGIVDLEKSMMAGGVANSVGMAQWADMVRKKGEKFGDFREVCGLTKDAPSRISFLQPQYQ